MIISHTLNRAKHPAKVHIWAGISWKGASTIVTFEGKMNAPGFIAVLKQGLLPMLEYFPEGHRLMMDNAEA